MLSCSTSVLFPAHRNRGGPATLGPAAYFLGSGSSRGTTQQRGDPQGKHRRASGGDGLHSVGRGEKGKWLLEDGRAGSGLTPHLVLPAKPRFLSAKCGGSWTLPLLGSRAPHHHHPLYRLC